MGIDDFVKWGTFGGAVVAGISGIFNLWWKAHEGDDKIKVGFDTLRPEATPTTNMHVVNLSDHAVEIVDYGYVYRHGYLVSLPWMFEVETPGDPDSQPFVSGSKKMEKRGDHYEIGVYLALGKAIGCYAQTATSDRHFYAWKHDTGLLDQMWARTCLFVKRRWK